MQAKNSGKRGELVRHRNSSIADIISKEVGEIRLLKEKFNILKDRYNITDKDFLTLLKAEIPLEIPISIFKGKLSPLEAVVKYLKENLGFRYSKIAKELNRDPRTIWITYRNAKIKQPSRLVLAKADIFIPQSYLRKRKWSMLESVVFYLKVESALKCKQIASLLNKKLPTIWTAYNRAKKKRGNG